MKRGIIITAGAVLLTATAVFYWVNKEKEALEEIFCANVEALSQVEQPDVNDCIPDPNYHCQALHPTDPSLDVLRLYARW